MRNFSFRAKWHNTCHWLLARGELKVLLVGEIKIIDEDDDRKKMLPVMVNLRTFLHILFEDLSKLLKFDPDTLLGITQ